MKRPYLTQEERSLARIDTVQGAAAILKLRFAQLGREFAKVYIFPFLSFLNKV